MRNNFQIGEDGSIFSIGDDGTIHRIAKIDTQGNVEGKSSNSSSIGILWFLFIAVTITAIVLGANLSSAKSDLSDILSSQSNLNIQISKLKQQNENLQSKFDELRERFPLKINRIELANSGDNYNYGQTLYTSTLKYLTPRIYFENYLKESKTFNFEIHYVDAYGRMEYNTTSGKIPTSEIYISTTDESKNLHGWGTETGGSWKSGNWTVEIWYNGVCLGSKKFTIY